MRPLAVDVPLLTSGTTALSGRFFSSGRFFFGRGRATGAFLRTASYVLGPSSAQIRLVQTSTGWFSRQAGWAFEVTVNGQRLAPQDTVTPPGALFTVEVRARLRWRRALLLPPVWGATRRSPVLQSCAPYLTSAPPPSPGGLQTKPAIPGVLGATATITARDMRIVAVMRKVRSAGWEDRTQRSRLALACWPPMPCPLTNCPACPLHQQDPNSNNSWLELGVDVGPPFMALQRPVGGLFGATY